MISLYFKIRDRCLLFDISPVKRVRCIEHMPAAIVYYSIEKMGLGPNSIFMDGVLIVFASVIG